LFLAVWHFGKDISRVFIVPYIFLSIKSSFIFFMAHSLLFALYSFGLLDREAFLMFFSAALFYVHGSDQTFIYRSYLDHKARFNDKPVYF